MKYVSLAAISLSLFLFSCKKDNTPEKIVDTKAKVAVNFSLSNFIQEVSDLNNPNGRKSNAGISSRANPLPGSINYIYYVVYDGGGNLEKVSNKNQDYTSSSFGSIVDSLPVGNYYAVFVASESPINFISGSNLYGGRIAANVESDTSIQRYPEIFLKKVNFTVTSAGASIGSAITLKRIVGSLRIKFKDYPQDMLLRVEVLSESTGFGFGNELPFRDAAKNYISLIPVENPNILGNGYVGNVLNTNEEFTIRVTGHNFLTFQNYYRIIEHVRCYPNKRTSLTGYLISSNASVRTGFDVTVDNIWEEGPTSSF